MDIFKQREAFKNNIAVSLDRILYIQNGIADQYSLLFKKYKANNASEEVIKNHLAEAKIHLNNIHETHKLIDQLQKHSFVGEQS